MFSLAFHDTPAASYEILLIAEAIYLSWFRLINSICRILDLDPDPLSPTVQLPIHTRRDGIVLN